MLGVTGGSVATTTSNIAEISRDLVDGGGGGKEVGRKNLRREEGFAGRLRATWSPKKKKLGISSTLLTRAIHSYFHPNILMPIAYTVCIPSYGMLY